MYLRIFELKKNQLSLFVYIYDLENDKQSLTQIMTQLTFW